MHFLLMSFMQSGPRERANANGALARVVVVATGSMVTFRPVAARGPGVADDTEDGFVTQRPAFGIGER